MHCKSIIFNCNLHFDLSIGLEISFWNFINITITLNPNIYGFQVILPSIDQFLLKQLLKRSVMPTEDQICT